MSAKKEVVAMTEEQEIRMELMDSVPYRGRKSILNDMNIGESRAFFTGEGFGIEVTRITSDPEVKYFQISTDGARVAKCESLSEVAVTLHLMQCELFNFGLA